MTWNVQRLQHRQSVDGVELECSTGTRNTVAKEKKWFLCLIDKKNDFLCDGMLCDGIHCGARSCEERLPQYTVFEPGAA